MMIFYPTYRRDQEQRLIKSERCEPCILNTTNTDQSQHFANWLKGSLPRTLWALHHNKTWGLRTINFTYVGMFILAVSTAEASIVPKYIFEKKSIPSSHAAANYFAEIFNDDYKEK